MGDYTITTRADGTKQRAYKGRPLYTWKNDKKPGGITGDGFLNNAWHMAQPSLSAATEPGSERTSTALSYEWLATSLTMRLQPTPFRFR